jgi:hypothetical protein
VRCIIFDIYRIEGDVETRDTIMKSLDMKLVFSALGIVAMLTGPAFAKKPHHVTAVVNGSTDYNMIPSYDKDGAVVGIPDPDQSTPSRR